MSMNPTKMEDDLLNNVKSITEIADSNLESFADFFKEELDYSSELEDRDLFLLTRLIWKAKSLTQKIPPEERDAISKIMKKYKVASNPNLLISTTMVRYIIKSLIEDISHFGLENEMDILLNLVDRAIGQYEKFSKEDW